MTAYYVFVDTKLSWPIGSSYNSLSFSSDGTTLAGATAIDTPGYPSGKVQFWDAANGTPTSSDSDSAFVTFSLANPDIAVVIGSKGIQSMKRVSPGAKAWSNTGLAHSNFNPKWSTAAFRSDGKIVSAMQGASNGSSIYEFDVDSFPTIKRYFRPDGICNFTYRPFDLDTIVVGYEDGHVEVQSYAGTGASTFRSAPSSTGSAKISACAWSQDGKWIATGDGVGDVRLWNASIITYVSLAKTLPAVNSTPIISLIFVPDSTAFIVLSALHLAVWDIGEGQYVSNSGLPATAKGIALDGPRNRLAVVVDDRVTLFERKLRTQQPKEKKMKTPTIPPELAAFDISDQVVKSKPEPFDGLYFHIYRGAWKLDKPRVFQHVVAIKALRPGFNSDSKAQDRQDFQNLLTKCINTWLNLTHDNLLPLLGVSMNFGPFPAMVTSWMINGIYLMEFSVNSPT